MLLKPNSMKTYYLSFLFILITGLPLWAQFDTVSYSVEFRKKSEKMWKQGSFSPNFKFDVFNEKWNSKGEFDGIEKILGSSFGLSMDAGSSGELGMNFSLKGMDGGHIDEIYYPVDIYFIMPEKGNFYPGQTVTIKSFYETKNTAYVAPVYPTGGKLSSRFIIEMNNFVNMKACLFDCSSTNINLDVPRLDTALFQISATPGETFFPGMTDLGLPSYACFSPPSFMPAMQYSDILPIQIEKEVTSVKVKESQQPDGTIKKDTTVFASPFFSATLDLPHIDSYSSQILPNNHLFTSGEYKYITTAFDVLGTLLRFSPYKLENELTLPGIGCFASLYYNIFSTDIVFDVTNKQEFDFYGDITATLNFPFPMDYKITSKNGVVIGSGTDSIIVYPIGADLELKFPCQYAHLDIYPTFNMKGTLNNKTYDLFGFSLHMEALEFQLNFEKVVIVPEASFDICLPLVGCETVSTPEVAFNPPDITIGPFWENDLPIASVPNEWYNDNWTVEGFNTVQSDKFRLYAGKFVVNLSTDSLLCFNDSNGIISSSISGGTAPYQFKWSDGSTDSIISNAHAGEYYTLVTDANKCRAYQGIAVLQPDSLSVQMSRQNVLCAYGTTGNIELEISGGTPAYSINWSNGETGNSISGLVAGSYTFTLTDANNCTITDSVVITEPSPLTAYINSITEPLCYGDSTGAINLVTDGGTPPYHFFWNTQVTTKNLKNIPAGNYSVTITDANNCQISVSQTIKQPKQLVASLSVSKKIDCYKGNNGELMTTISGGSSPYNISWFSSSTAYNNKSDILSGLSEDWYKVEISDSNFCQTNDSIYLEAKDKAIEINFETTEPLCFASTDGSITAMVDAPHPDKEFKWSNGASGSQISGLTAGIYSLYYTDSAGCQASAQTVLFQPDSISLQSTVMPTSCKQEKDGSIELTISGGTSPYYQVWNDFSTDTYRDSLSAGVYTLEITDANNCTKRYDFEVKSGEADCIEIPNSFSPNGDGINDTWLIRKIELYPNHTLSVFNKWSEKVFDSRKNPEPWDGTYKNKPLPAATYYFILDFGDGSELIKGSITIVR